MKSSEKYFVSLANHLDSTGDKEGAIKLYKKALSKNRKSIISLTNLATVYYEIGNYKKAMKYCNKVLSLDSENVSAVITMGNVSYMQRDLDSALNYYLQASSIKPDYYVAEINLANTYLDLKDYKKAILHARNATLLDSSSVVAQIVLGNSYLELNKNDEALTALLKAKKLDSLDPWIFNSLSQVYQKKLDWEKALQHAWNAIKVSDGDDSQHMNFGYLLYEFFLETGDKKAEKYAKKWLDNYPENSMVLHMAGSIKKVANIDRANNEYLTKIFDVFAPDFEEVLNALDYRVPEIISGFLKGLSEQKKIKKGRVLDAGCGTGLCGGFLKTYSSWRGLEGVDISSNMLDVSRSKKLYNKLHCSELTEFFSKHKNKYNLIVLADVFTYIGDLKILFDNMKKSLKKNGVIVFSISENDDEKNGFSLDISGRFLHSKNYIKTLLKENGFEIENFERHKLRNEGDKEIYGFVVAAKSL